MMYHKDAKAVENPQYHQVLEDHLMRVNEVRRKAEAAQGKRKADLERITFYYEELKETARWLISPQQMDAWLDFSKFGFVQQLTPERQGALTAYDVLRGGTTFDCAVLIQSNLWLFKKFHNAYHEYKI